MYPGQRFSSFSTSQNIGLVDLKSIKDSEIYNTITNELRQASKELEATAKAAVQGLLPEGVSTDDIRDLIDDSVRKVKDTFTGLRDLTNFTQSDIEKEIAYMLPGDIGMQNAFRNLATSCRDNALSKSPGFKPFKDSASCGVPGSGKCQSGEIRGFFDKLTGGAIGTVAKTIQQMLKQLIALGNLGYSGSLCKIFAQLTNSMPAGVIQRGAASLVATFGGLGNMPAVMDIAANMGLANPSLEVPSLVKRVAENYLTPSNVTRSSYGDYYDGILTTLNSIDPGWDQGDGGIMSIAKMGMKNLGLQDVATEYVKTFTDFSLKVPDLKSGVSQALAYIAPNTKSNRTSSAINGLVSLFA